MKAQFTLVWTREMPKVTGWYWVERKDGWRQIWDIDEDYLAQPSMHIVRYAGPIPAPGEPEQGA